MRTLLVDSDAAWMAEKIQQSYPACQVVGVYPHGHANLKDFQSRRPEAAIVSLDLPGIDGLDLANLLLKKGCEVIISSEWSTFAYEALRSGAADYLLKPCAEEDLQTAIGRVLRRVSEKAKLRDVASRADPVPAPGQGWNRPGYIAVRARENISFVPVDQIIRFEAQKGQWTIFLENAPPLPVNCDTSRLEQKLSPYPFIRTGRDCMVNLHKVERFQLQKNEFVLTDGARVKVAKGMQEEVRERLKEF
ncbi:MAG: LytTR family DNA-binding domain-containing protein [Thermoanaerobaculia bacterium]|nr:LytTR family DNA-binding domain-containing protein [Thermoanaerobaculia bacterium]